MPITLNNGTVTFGDGTTQGLADGFPNFSSRPGLSYDTWYQASSNSFVIQKLIGSFMNASVTYVGPSTSSYTRISMVGNDMNFNSWGKYVGFFIRKGSWVYITSNGDGGGFAGNYSFESPDWAIMPAAL